MAFADHSPKRTPGGRSIITVALIAAFFTLVGILIASNFDFTPRSEAQSPGNIVGKSAYPVVERNGEVESPFVAVVERVTNAVVNISARQRGNEVPWWHQGPAYSTSSGSGFFFREDGYILTNNHVVKDAVKLSVWTSSGYRYDAQLVGADPLTDLAVIKVEPEEEVTFIPFGNSDNIKIGDWAIAIGNPFPQQGLDRTVTVGVISAKGRSNLQFGNETPLYQSYIQTDASINPGNSGGPLLNLQGECIGVNAAISSPTGTSVGIGFAIPINMAKAIVPDLIADGRPSRGWLGVWLSDVTQREAKRQGMERVRGVMIDSVFAGSPAEQAGMKSGDIVIAFDGKEVENASQLSVLVSTIKHGTHVPVGILREGDETELETLIADRETFLASNTSQRSRDDAVQGDQWLGMELTEFTPESAKALNIDYVEGVYVSRVYAGSPADNASISRGTIIIQVNDIPVKSLSDLESVVQSLDRGKSRIPLIVQEPDGSAAMKVVRP